MNIKFGAPVAVLVVLGLFSIARPSEKSFDDYMAGEKSSDSGWIAKAATGIAAAGDRGAFIYKDYFLWTEMDWRVNGKTAYFGFLGHWFKCSSSD